LSKEYWGVCDVKGCNEESCSGGMCWRDSGYWRVCRSCYQKFKEGKPQPQMKKRAIKRELNRDKYGYLK